MDRHHCEICGRRPAKYMSFAGHQGFVIVRRVTTYSGVFCRDHAIEAAAMARGVSLKGMWFGTVSLIFGATRTLWDSLQLLELPDEVQDSPWMLHKVGCASCGKGYWGTVGEFDCDSCHTRQAVVSCEMCSTVHTCKISNRETVESVEISKCRKCGNKTSAPAAARNWYRIVVAKMIAEIAAEVATADNVVDNREREAYLECIAQMFPFRRSTITFLNDYFDSCANKKEGGLLLYIENCTDEFRGFLVRLAIAIARSDGIIHQSEIDVVVSIIKRLGLHTSEFFDSEEGRSNAENDESCSGSSSWWEVLEISKNAGPEEVKIAYYRLARQYHPDLLSHLPESEKQRALLRIKKINIAYEIAKEATKNRQDFRRSEAANTKAREPSSSSNAQASTNSTRSSSTEHDTGGPSRPSGSPDSRGSNERPSSGAKAETVRTKTKDSSGAFGYRTSSSEKQAPTNGNPSYAAIFLLTGVPFFFFLLLVLLTLIDSRGRIDRAKEFSTAGASSAASNSKTSVDKNRKIAVPGPGPPISEEKLRSSGRTWFLGNSKQPPVDASLVRIREGKIELSNGRSYGLNQLSAADKSHVLRDHDPRSIGFQLVSDVIEGERVWMDKTMRFSVRAKIYARSGNILVLYSSTENGYLFVDITDLSYSDAVYLSAVRFEPVIIPSSVGGSKG